MNVKIMSTLVDWNEKVLLQNPLYLEECIYTIISFLSTDSRLHKNEQKCKITLVDC